MAPQEKVELEIIGLSSGQTQGSYTLILGEKTGKRKLAIIIGAFEAQAIAIEIEKIIPFRPMTHDLFLKLTEQFQIAVQEIIIYDLKEGVFYARMICERMGVSVQIDCRTSDAISLAVRFKCPVYTYEFILQEAGHEFNMEGEEEEQTEDDTDTTNELPSPAPRPGDLSGFTTDEIQTMLDEAIRDEDYDKAVKLRDELQRRK